MLPRLDFDPRRECRAPLQWVSELGCWCVYDAYTITAILKSTDFAVADFAALHRTYEQKVGIDCSTLIQILHYIATANEGKRHAEIRRDAARLLTRDVAQTKQLISARLNDLTAKLCRPGARVDLIKQIVRPVCDTMFESLLGSAPPGQAEDGVSASQIFDLYLSLNRRREINAKAYAMIADFSAAKGKLKTSPEYATALSMLGYDSIVGSIGCSLLHVLDNASGRQLCEVAFPRILPATGVPYIERFAAKDSVIQGTPIRKGDRIRLYLDSGTPGEDAANRPFFGRGRHSCLGEEMSSWVWQCFADEFSRLPVSCAVESAKRRKPDWVFTYYSSIVVRFDA